MNGIIKAKILLLQCLSQFDTEEEKVTETLYNVYPDEMIAIERLIASLSYEAYLKAWKERNEQKPITDEEIEAFGEKEYPILWKDMSQHKHEIFIKGFKAALKLTSSP